MLPYNKNLKPFSRNLRKNLTEAENLLWSQIRRRQLNGFRFNRQKIIGEYIVDFCCHQAKLVIELDGIQHYSEVGNEWDKVRDDFLKSLDLKVLRFSNEQVLCHIESVIKKFEKNYDRNTHNSPIS